MELESSVERRNRRRVTICCCRCCCDCYCCWKRVPEIRTPIACRNDYVSKRKKKHLYDISTFSAYPYTLIGPNLQISCLNGSQASIGSHIPTALPHSPSPRPDVGALHIRGTQHDMIMDTLNSYPMAKYSYSSPYSFQFTFLPQRDSSGF